MKRQYSTEPGLIFGYIWALVFSTALCASEHSPDKQEAKWITTVFEPWLTKEHEQYSGLLYQLVKAGLRTQQIDVKIIETPVWRTKLDLQDGKGDFIVWPETLIPSTADTTFHAQFNCETFVFEHPLFGFGLKKSFGEAIKKAEFKNYKIVSRPLPDQVSTSLFGEIRYEKSVQPTPQMLKLLLTARADIIVSTNTGIAYAAKKLGVSDKIAIVHQFDKSARYRICFSQQFLATQNTSFLASFKRAVITISKSEQYVNLQAETLGMDLISNYANNMNR